MEGINKVMLIGNLGADPELRKTHGGKSVGNIRLATTTTYGEKGGTRKERTEWHRIVVWGRTAELCHEHLTKGRQIYVEGELQTREWKDTEGHTHYATEIVASQVRFLGHRAEPKPTGSSGVGPDAAARGGEPPPFSDEDVPF
ncbi:single-stranded DNA-binding protein [Myxococcus sp. MISCRS1]|uniref:single-stranded DNA-binding protein n=1 Tax=Myxococcus sp. MISCRS1 TaxID=2996786 RepID=UPI002271BFA9|nr:single-stranded DNA-binding protein [Myxococcus sp. MISCRS1]MCY1003968.1 single-stranded DNA-binding protein [Myxococcus sp. MISCRS1]